jgi:cell wall-associated NlpC family hydrolase
MPNSPVARRRHRRFVTVAGALVTVAAFAGALAPTAGAQSLGDKRKQAAELADQIEASDVEISGFAEQLNAATARYDTAQATVKDAELRIANAKAEVASIKQQLRESGVSLYTEGGSGDAGIDFSEASDLARRDQYAEARSEREDRLLEELDAAQSDLRAQRADATKARDDAAAEAAKITAAKTQIETARAAQQALLDSVTGEIAAEVAAERARREEAARVEYAVPENYPDVGPPNGSAAQAIAFARAVIGSPYSTSPRTGPSYDCSGLVMSAWGAAGVNISGSSGSMYASLPHIPISAAQPGDLIFWGSGGSSHVALYVGGGQIIDASSSQNAVVQRGIWGSPVGAARVT